MAKKERETVDRKRIWAKATAEAVKALKHLAIDLDRPVEELAGDLIAEAAKRWQAEYDAKKKGKS